MPAQWTTVDVNTAVWLLEPTDNASAMEPLSCTTQRSVEVKYYCQNQLPSKEKS